MKTLYEILEVSESASKEIIEKAYKVLAKKYHPDLQTPENKETAENYMKQINEAYSVLSDETKRKEYDNKLAIERQNNELKQEENNNANYQNSNQSSKQYYSAQPQKEDEYTQKLRQEAIKKQQEMQQEIKRNMEQQYQQKYQNAYENYLRSLGYKIKYKWTWKNYRDFLITILVIIAVCTILWIFPPTHKLLMDFYQSNPIIKTIIDVIVGIFVGIWNAICSIFK